MTDHGETKDSGCGVNADICTCGCGKSRDEVVSEIASRHLLNWDQAEALFDEANRTRAASVTP